MNPCKTKQTSQPLYMLPIEKEKNFSRLLAFNVYPLDEITLLLRPGDDSVCVLAELYKFFCGVKLLLVR